MPHAAVEGLSNDPSEAAFVKLKSDLTEGSLGEGPGWFEPCDPGPEPNYYYSVNLRGWEEGRGDIQFQENRKEEVCGEVLYKFTNIQKQKQKKKAHLSNENDCFFFISGKKLYTHDLNFFFNFNSFWQS